MQHWDYFEPEKRDCSRECATKKYVDTRDDTMLRTALDKIEEVNKDAQSDWAEQDPDKASYIKNKPDIPSMQQQADWAETDTSAVDYIKNKPTFATVATSGDYDDLLNTPTIPAAQINADWSASSGVAEILNKPTIPVVPTQVSAFNNDANYQSGSQVSSAIASAVAGITSFEYEIVQTLPGTGRAGTIYLVPATGVAPNIYDEYIYVSNAFEKIGSTDIDLTNYVQFTDLATVATSGSYNDLSDKPAGMVILSYGSSTWNDFITAYQGNRIVYCRASSSADPSTGSQTRLAFMAYVNNPTSPTEVEFQYVRSVSSKTAAQQMDQVFVYKLTSAGGGTWTVTTRDMTSKIVAGTNMTSSYSNGTLTLNATGGGSGVVELTSANYDYPTNNPTSVAIWNLPDGVYHSASGVSVVLNTQEGYSLDTVWTIHNNGTYACYTRNVGDRLSYGVTKISDGTAPGYSSPILRESNLANNLTTTATGKALDARQGKVLDEKIPVITMQTTDPGEGVTLAENHFIAVYQ